VDPFSDAAPDRAPTLADAPSELPNPHPTGITQLDELLGGGFFVPSSVIIWGPPGSGKTTLALHFARHSSRVLLVGLEMNVQLYRYAAERAGVDAHRIVLAESESASGWIREAQARRCPTVIVDSLGKVPNPLATMAELAAAARAGAPRLVLAIAHNTRRDDARGGESLEHEPETLLFLEPGRVTVKKHRIGPGGSAEISWPPE
jgi:DNA repair protein RadA/Sms